MGLFTYGTPEGIQRAAKRPSVSNSLSLSNLGPETIEPVLLQYQSKKQHIYTYIKKKKKKLYID